MQSKLSGPSPHVVGEVYTANMSPGGLAIKPGTLIDVATNEDGVESFMRGDCFSLIRLWISLRLYHFRQTLVSETLCGCWWDA